MSTKGVAITDRLNVRSGPGTNFSILCQLAQGTQVKVKKEVDDWKELDLTVLEGYLNRAYVVLTSPKAEGQQRINYGIVEADALNIRSGPGYEFQTLSIIHQGEVVEIVDELTEWLRIKTRQLNGFMMKDLLVEVLGGGIISGGLYVAKINEELANLRSGPGLNYSIIAVLAKDTEVKVKGTKDGWLELETLCYEGYIRKEFVKESTIEGIPLEDSDAIATGTTTANQLSLRSGPGESYPPLAFLNTGIQVKVRDIATNWLRVQPMIDSAFALGSYIRDIEATIPGVPPPVIDLLKPPANELIPIQDNFSEEQKVMATTWNQYGGLITQISSQCTLNPAVALAVLCVESGGNGFAPDGRMIIRFENHYFYNYWGTYNENIYKRHFRFDSEKPWYGQEYRKNTSSPWQPVHTGFQSSEWEVFEFANQFNNQAALKSISMGSPQIMGANYSLIGYSSVEQMFNEFQADIRNQIWGLFRFFQAKNLIPALISENFIEFARGYNGSTQAATYGNKIKKHVDEFRLISPFV